MGRPNFVPHFAWSCLSRADIVGVKWVIFPQRKISCVQVSASFMQLFLIRIPAIRHQPLAHHTESFAYAVLFGIGFHANRPVTRSCVYAGARNSRRSPSPVNGQRHPCDVRGIVAQQKGHLHPVHARAWSAFRSMHARIRRCAALTGHSPAPPRHESKASTLCWTTHRGRDLLRASSPPHRSTFQGEPRQWCLGNRILHVCSGGGR